MQAYLETNLAGCDYQEMMLPAYPYPQLARPASASAIETLSKNLVQKSLFLPQSFSDFLNITNGIKNFDDPAKDFSLLKAEEIPGRKNNFYKSYSRFIIGQGDSLEFIAFDPEKVLGREMAVVWINDIGEEARYANFSAFLHETFEGFKQQHSSIIKKVKKAKSFKDA